MANERPESCYKTCFTLQHRGKILDEFAMVHTVENLTDGETVKCVAGETFLNIGFSWFNLIMLTILHNKRF